VLQNEVHDEETEARLYFQDGYHQKHPIRGQRLRKGL